MSADEIAGIVVAATLGAATLLPVGIRLVRDPRAWVMWAALGSFVALLGLFLVLGLAADWGGRRAAVQRSAVECARRDTAYAVTDWNVRPLAQACPSGFSLRFEYCESFASGFVKQAVNTWSALAFSAAAFWGLFFLRRRRDVGANDVMRTFTVFSVGLALTLVFVWWGTMALHASGRSWGGYLDAFSILVWLIFAVVYSLGRRFGLLATDSTSRVLGFLAVFFALVVTVGVIAQVAPGVRLVFLIAFGAILIALELAVLVYQSTVAAARPRTVTRSWRWYLAVIGAFAVAFVCKLLADFLPPASRWCRPDSPLQGHTLWHVFAALTAFFGFMYYRAEVYRPGLTRFD